MLSRRTILLKPMQPALSGYARLQTDNRCTTLQLHARGLEPGERVRLYWYLSGQAAQEMAAAAVNAHGEVSVEAQRDDVHRLQAVILISDEAQPRPLLIGLCDGGLLDAKNAALALCERLRAASQPREEESPAPSSEPPKPAALHGLPREVFLPAIDPAPYATANEKETDEPFLPPPLHDGPPVDRLRPLAWPRGFESLKPYFDNAIPAALFDLPGWRFVHAAQGGGPDGLWIGIQQQDGRVCGVAYSHTGDRPPARAKGWQTLQGLDGQMYQVLWQKV